jgi:hypothetical protein
VFDIDAIGCRVGFSDEGFELIQPVSEAAEPLQATWRGPLAAVGIKVDDLEDARRRMAELGRHPTSEVETPGGVRELFYADGLAGLPMVVAHYGDRGFATEIGATGDRPYEPRLISAGEE